MQFQNPYMSNPYMQQAIVPPAMQQMIQQQAPAMQQMGHTDPMQIVRDLLASNPELRSQLRNELM